MPFDGQVRLISTQLQSDQVSRYVLVIRIIKNDIAVINYIMNYPFYNAKYKRVVRDGSSVLLTHRI